jgi:hypothetical protein
MTSLIAMITGKVVVIPGQSRRIWHFKGQGFDVYVYFAEDPGLKGEISLDKNSASALKSLLVKVRSIWGEDEADCDDIVHDCSSSQMLDQRCGGVEIGLPYNNQDPKEHDQIRNFTTLLVNLSGFLSDEWVRSHYPEYSQSLRNIRKVLAWTYGKGTGAFLRNELIAGKKRLGIPFEVYHDPSIEPYYAARDKDGNLIGRGTGHGF